MKELMNDLKFHTFTKMSVRKNVKKIHFLNAFISKKKFIRITSV